MRLLAIILIVLTSSFTAVSQKTNFVEPRLEGYIPFTNPIAPDASTSIARYLPMYATAPTCVRKGQMYFNTTSDLPQYCTATGSPGTWANFAAGTSGAPTDATYITQTPNGSLSAEQALSALSSGIMRVETTTGVITSLTDSAGLAANLSDETGSSGGFARAVGPTFVTPTLGVAAATSLTTDDGSAASPALKGAGDADTGIYFNTNNIRFSGNGTTMFAVDAIGVSTGSGRWISWTNGVGPDSGSRVVAIKHVGNGLLEVNDGNTEGATAALLSGRQVLAKTTGYTVLSIDKSTFFTNTGAGAGVTFTLPTPVVGMTYEFYRDANQTVTVDIAAGVTIRVGASVTTNGGNVTLDAVGSRIRIVAISTTQWVGDISGTVTFN